MKVAQSHLTLCDPMGYIVHGILQARILEWVAFPLNYHTIALIWHASKVMFEILQARFQQYVNQVMILLATKWLPKTVNKCLCTSFLSLYPIRDTATATAAKSLQSCLTLCDPIDGSLPGSPVPGILQARTLEWVAMSFSKAWKWYLTRWLFSLEHLQHGVSII